MRTPPIIQYKIFVFCLILVVVHAGINTAALAAPITFNTALPVAEGEGIFRVQSKYIHSTGDPTSLDRELNVWSFPIIGVYGMTENLSVFGVIPILDKDLELNTPGGRQSRGGGGLGDIRFIARYTAKKWDSPGLTLRIAPFVALEVPTGQDDERDHLGRLPQPLQLGSGSWDPSIGVVVTRQTLKQQVDASLSYQFNTEANNFQFGDVVKLDVSYQHRLLPYELKSGVPDFVYGVLESNIIWQDHNRVHGAEDNDSGGTTVYLAPGIQYVTKRFVVETAIQLPVVQDLNGNALENDYIATISFRVNF
jgi:hypothetical protein